MLDYQHHCFLLTYREDKSGRITQMAVENARMLFRSGFADYLEVITAQSETLSSELELVSTKTKLLVQRVQLYRALGGGWY